VNPRDILSRPSGSTPNAARWFAAHPEAAELVREWERMRLAGETDWSRAHLLRYLHEHFSFPFRNDDPIREWLKSRPGRTEE
jgi:hypothetical protein